VIKQKFSDMKKIFYTEKAQQDLISIWSYIAEDNHYAADKILDLIYEKCKILAENPHIGQSRDDIAVNMRYFPIKNYLALYQINCDGVEIVRILHGSMDLYSIFH